MAPREHQFTGVSCQRPPLFELAKRPAHGAILSVKDGKISHYDDLFRRYAKEIGWDWRLLASLAYTESNFNPNVVSWAGAKGLMQLMPATARAMGVPPGKEQDPEESIKAAVKYIAGMQRTFSKITDKEEQAKFILAAYNSGIGHVTDAMALAENTDVTATSGSIMWPTLCC